MASADSNPYPCLVMKRLGPSLETTRGVSGTSLWSWKSVAYIGVQLLNVVEDMHTQGFAHTDLHLWNALQVEAPNPEERTKIADIDLGDMVTLGESGNRSTDFDYITEDLKQVIVSLAFLRTGDRRFFAAKRFDYSELRDDLVAAAPAVYAQAVDLVYS